jgi:hypothetical protein
MTRDERLAKYPVVNELLARAQQRETSAAPSAATASAPEVAEVDAQVAALDAQKTKEGADLYLAKADAVIASMTAPAPAP